MVVRITAAKDQDIFGSEAAQGILLQSAKLISSTGACKGRSRPGTVLIGSLHFLLMQVSQFAKLRVHQHVRRWGSQRAVFEDAFDWLHDRTNPCAVSVKCFFIDFT